MRLFEINDRDDIVARAQALAARAHSKQKYGDQPYVTHLKDVVDKVLTITDDPEVIAAAWLHDAIEDTQVTYGDIEREFGANVARMVWAVTGVGQNRAEKMKSAIDKISQIPNSELIKSADRLSNVQASQKNNPKKLQIYRNEHRDLSPVLGNNALAQELVKIFST